jgi:hypothetical protein
MTDKQNKQPIEIGDRAVIIALDITDQNIGEISRVWPFFQLALPVVAHLVNSAYQRGRAEALESTQPPAQSFQNRVKSWLLACFGAEIASDRLERADRFIEECFELLQSGDYPKERIYALVDYVYGREKGEPSQEVGGVMTTLAAYCQAHDLDMHEAGEAELARIWTKVNAIRAKQAAKLSGSALLIAAPEPEANNE